MQKQNLQHQQNVHPTVWTGQMSEDAQYDVVRSCGHECASWITVLKKSHQQGV
jgi:hypothetical protein